MLLLPRIFTTESFFLSLLTSHLNYNLKTIYLNLSFQISSAITKYFKNNSHKQPFDKIFYHGNIKLLPKIFVVSFALERVFYLIPNQNKKISISILIKFLIKITHYL